MEEQAVEFLQHALNLALEVLPVGSKHDIKHNVDFNTDEDRIIGGFQLPLVYGYGQSEQPV